MAILSHSKLNTPLMAYLSWPPLTANIAASAHETANSGLLRLDACELLLLAGERWKNNAFIADGCEVQVADNT